MVGMTTKSVLRTLAFASLVVVSACGRSAGEKMVYENCMDTMSDKKLCGCTADAFDEYLKADDFDWLAEMSEGDGIAFGNAVMASAFGDGDPETAARLKRVEVAGKKAEQCL